MWAPNEYFLKFIGTPYCISNKNGLNLNFERPSVFLDQFTVIKKHTHQFNKTRLILRIIFFSIHTTNEIISPNVDGQHVLTLHNTIKYTLPRDYLTIRDTQN